MLPMPAHQSVHHKAKYNKSRKSTNQPLKKGVTKIFRAVNLYKVSIFDNIFSLHCDIILFAGMNIIFRSSPQLRYQFLTGHAACTHFVVIN